MQGSPPLIYLVAGEPSGDALGARLMAALKRQTGGQVRFAGVGGDAMAGQGLESLFPMTELSVMGVFEVLPHARRLFRRMAEAAAEVDRLQPSAVITIDAPAFAHGFVKRIRSRAIPRIHYVAPSVWAWRPWRVHKFKRHFDHLLALLPFEPPYFDRVGLPCRFVGHPVVETVIPDGAGDRFRAAWGIPKEATLVCVLPGSRRGEVNRLEPVFADAISRLQRRRPDLQAVIPTVAGVADMIEERTAHWSVPVHIVRGESDKTAAMAASQAALAASGTVALELAHAGVPGVIGYKVPWATYQVLKRMVRVRYANLINILLDDMVVPERLQAACRADVLAADLERLLDAGEEQISRVAPALAQLTPAGAAPCEHAAAAVLEIAAGSSPDRVADAAAPARDLATRAPG